MSIMQHSPPSARCRHLAGTTDDDDDDASLRLSTVAASTMAAIILSVAAAEECGGTAAAAVAVAVPPVEAGIECGDTVKPALLLREAGTDDPDANSSESSFKSDNTSSLISTR